MTPDGPTDVAELEAVARELMDRVRDDDPEANWWWVVSALPDPHDWLRLAFVLAVAAPTDVPWRHLTAWTLLGPGQAEPRMVRDEVRALVAERFASPLRHAAERNGTQRVSKSDKR